MVRSDVVKSTSYDEAIGVMANHLEKLLNYEYVDIYEKHYA